MFCVSQGMIWITHYLEESTLAELEKSFSAKFQEIHLLPVQLIFRNTIAQHKSQSMQRVFKSIKQFVAVKLAIIKLEGISTIEVLMAIALFGILVANISTTIIYVVRTSSDSTKSIKAAQLVNEGIEAVRDMKNANFGVLVDGTYGLATPSGSWTFSGTSDVTDVYTRSVTIAADLTNSILPDVVSKKVTVSVSWGSPVKTNTISEMMTNWRRNKPVVANWALPTQQSVLDLSGTADLYKVIKSGNYLYGIRSGTSNNFVVINVTDPNAPVYVTQLSLSGTMTDIAITGNYVYVSSNDNTREVSVVNVTNPLSPVFAGSFNASGNTDATGLYIVGNRLYLSRIANGTNEELTIVNITNRTSPTQVSIYNTPSHVTANDVFVIGNYVYLATAGDSNELIVVDITNELAPTYRAAVNLPTSNDGVVLEGFTNTILIGNIVGMIYTVNVTNPLAPVALGSYNAQGRVYGIAFTGDNKYAFLATYYTSAEFQVIDLNTLTAPTLFGSYVLSGTSLARGVYYDSVLDKVFCSTTGDSGELVIFKPT